MRAVFDVTSALLPGSGVKTHIYFWAKALREAAGRNELALFPFVHALGELDHRRSTQGAISTAIRLKIMGAANGWNLPLADLASRRADLFHVSQHLTCLPSRVKLTATLFDMSCWIVPETHTTENVKATKAYAEHVLKRVDGIVSISESARRDAMAILSLSGGNIEVIPPGVHDAFFRVGSNDVARVRRRYGLPPNYILYLGTIEPRKNIDMLMNAYSTLPRGIRNDWPLIIAGPEGWKSTVTLERARSTAHGWRYLGYVPESDAPGLTAGASIFVFPSLFEGFGLPVAQAMAAGVACITSNASSLPEVAGDAAVLVDPRSESDLTDALRRLIESPQERSALAVRGRVRADRYTWAATAVRTWNFFERIVGADDPEGRK
jgi:glycosyltransferase involved in cell wall biosynthesis